MSRPEDIPRVGLCATCVHARVKPHPRGGLAYYRCGRQETDKRYPKYPPLPVRACPGHEPEV